MLSIILFVLTFVFGVLRFLTWTKLFEESLLGFIKTISPFHLIEFWQYLDKLIFYFSLCYQTYFWASRLGLFCL